jgi:hypothetical protein
MAKTIEIRPFADRNIVSSWWQWALVGIVAASGFIGLVTGIAWIIRTLWSGKRVSGVLVDRSPQTTLSRILGEKGE